MKPKNRYPEPKRIKSGRNLFVVDFDNRTPLAGLSWDAGNGQYYYTFFKDEKDVQTGKKTRKDYSFGVDYQEAVFRFKNWKQDTQKVSLAIPDKDVSFEFELDEKAPNFESFVASAKTSVQYNKQYALHLLKQFLNDEQLRIEAIRLLNLNDLLPKQYKTVSLKDICQYYKDNNPVCQAEKRRAEKTIEMFEHITKKKNINDITEDDMFTYKKYLTDMFEHKKMSTTWLNGWFKRIKAVLNFYNQNKQGNGEKELVKKVYEYCSVLKKVKEVIKFPAKSIDVKTAKEIFQKAKNDSELLLMLLLMLNTGYYPTDLRNLKKDMIKTKGGLTYILFKRIKTGEQFIRVNCLWDITAKLLKKQCEKFPHSEYVFVSDNGGMYAESTLCGKFREFFKDMGTITAKHFRDTVASELAYDVTNINILKVTLGHSIGNSKEEFWKYVESRPEKQKPAADILYKKFEQAIKIVK